MSNEKPKINRRLAIQYGPPELYIVRKDCDSRENLLQLTVIWVFGAPQGGSYLAKSGNVFGDVLCENVEPLEIVDSDAGMVATQRIKRNLFSEEENLRIQWQVLATKTKQPFPLIAVLGHRIYEHNDKKLTIFVMEMTSQETSTSTVAGEDSPDKPKTSWMVAKTLVCFAQLRLELARQIDLMSSPGIGITAIHDIPPHAPPPHHKGFNDDRESWAQFQEDALVEFISELCRRRCLTDLDVTRKFFATDKILFE
eukprot:gene4042-8046_t